MVCRGSWVVEWEIDPRKDINHVYNKDLHLLFKDKCHTRAIPRRGVNPRR